MYTALVILGQLGIVTLVFSRIRHDFQVDIYEMEVNNVLVK